MRLETAFRLLHHLSLALASVCLVIVQEPFLPDLYVYLFPLPLLVFGVFFLGDRSLPNWAANLFGFVTLVISSRWMWRNLTHAESVFENVAFPAILIPYAGLLLLLLTLVILLRSRRPADFWRLQGLGLVQVAVACTLAGPPIFGLTLFAYLACALTCLSLRQRLAERTSEAGLSGLRRLGAFGLRWGLGVAALAVGLALLTPRPNVILWDPYSQFGARLRHAGPGPNGLQRGDRPWPDGGVGPE